jgi:hypothetical protein
MCVFFFGGRGFSLFVFLFIIYTLCFSISNLVTDIRCVMCNTAIGIYSPPDVRPILKAYQGKDIPIEYAKREAEDKQAHIENWSKKGKRVDVTFSSLFGGSSVSPLPFQKASDSRLRLTTNSKTRSTQPPQSPQPTSNRSGKRPRRCTAKRWPL